MSKIVLSIIFALAVSSFAFTIDQTKSLIDKDQCATEILSELQPEILRTATKLKQNPENIVLKEELSVLMERAKGAYEKCHRSTNLQNNLGDPVKAAGIGFLLASNCFKDVGALLLIGDSIIQDPSNVVNDVVVLIFLYILGRQGVADCEQFLHYIR